MVGEGGDIVRIGAHLSSSGDFVAAAKNAAALSLNCVQHFTRNPRGGRQRELRDEEPHRHRAAREEMDLDPVVMHTPYTVNLASTKPRVVQFARRCVAEDLSLCVALAAPYLVLHPGSHGGQGPERAAKRIIEGLHEVMEAIEPSRRGSMLLLEMMAGQGNEYGSTPKELATILDGLGWHPGVGLCIDTCHSFARGYPLHTADGLDAYLESIEDTIGVDRIHVVHLNDSKQPLNSRRDRHALVGEGEIGLEGIERIVNHPTLRALPFILEVPVDHPSEYGEQARLVRSLRESGSTKTSRAPRD